MTQKHDRRMAKALRAMKTLGINLSKAKPVLNHLLKLYDKNWTIIEEDNYRALADAIFDRDESKAVEESRKVRNERTCADGEDTLDEDTPANQEPEQALKRLQHSHHDCQTSSSEISFDSMARNPIQSPLEETIGLPISPFPKIAGPHNVAETTKENDRPDMMGHSIANGKGKQTLSPKTSILVKNSDACQPSAISSEIKSLRPNIGSITPHTMMLRKRAKGSVFPQVSPRKKRQAVESSSPPVPLTEPKVDSGSVCCPNALVVDQSNGGGLFNGFKKNMEICKQKSSASRTREAVAVTDSQRELRNHSEVPLLAGAQSLEIVGSPSGEVKMFLSVGLNSKKSNFRMPDMKSVFKSVEAKCLQKHKSLDHSFSLSNIFEKTCQCVLELGSSSNSGSLKPSNVIKAKDAVNKSAGTNAQGSSGLRYNTRNGSNYPLSAVVPQVPCVQTCNMGIDSDIVKNGSDRMISSEESNCLSMKVIDKPHKSSETICPLNSMFDIAKGEEKIEITVVNEVNSELPPSFCYIPQNAVFENAYINFCMARIENNDCSKSCSGDCLSSPFPCPCAEETGGEFAYTPDGVVKEKFLKESISMNRDPKKHCQFFCQECPLERSKCEDTVDPCKGHLVRNFIKECWRKCGCGKQCGNRVVQRGITHKLQVFMTPKGKGWGLRTLEDLPEGAFVCEYVGEVLTNAELFERVSRSRKGEKHSYPVLLDADWCAEGVLKDEEALCLDATHYGNVARFINHRCYDSNMVEIPVEIETPDHHYYHLAFFTTRKVKAMEELTWDYGIDFDDNEHPVKAFQCHCGSKFCRNLKRAISSFCRIKNFPKMMNTCCTNN